jgi:hypothetical protein
MLVDTVGSTERPESTEQPNDHYKQHAQQFGCSAGSESIQTNSTKQGMQQDTTAAS